MTAATCELVQLFETGDLQSLILLVGRAWLRRYYPESRHASLVVDMGPFAPASQVVFTSSGDSVSDLELTRLEVEERTSA